MDKRAYIYIAFIVALGVFLFLARKGKYDEYYQSKIDGSINDIHRYREYVIFTVGANEYSIIPISLTSTAPFDAIAVVGDYLHKDYQNDTLSLTHQGNQHFIFIVQKY